MSANGAFTIVHPTDFSAMSEEAFVHALEFALAMRARLLLAHVQSPDTDAAVPMWDHFPRVRETLARWGALPADAPASAVAGLGVEVAKYDIRDRDFTGAIETFARTHAAELLVLGTHGGDDLARRLAGSAAELMAERLLIPALLVPLGARGFVDGRDGEVSLDRILVPVDHHPDPRPAIRRTLDLMKRLGIPRDALEFLHVGDDAPSISLGAGEPAVCVETAYGPVVEAILDAAQTADLIVMATQGRRGFLDALRGSTTQRVVRQAPCPVLAVPSL